MYTVNVCSKCNRNLTDTEVQFYGHKCIDCIYHELHPKQVVELDPDDSAYQSPRIDA